ncbi:Appr-1-p processing protein [Pseudoflavonifractor sp. 524-17]|uniref:macro domain-containing protein n=1 Tax=Pseudoflavonifractor sp. 524-17 TaxID=2304577 RepID=UPI00137AA8F7|nr:macro domain-containing protein [Pseudoflavonifractor sp. 524-17]NCE65212.1 Appr-1-p processing protein [Pseudoflavonifractor sp. 524-17]
MEQIHYLKGDATAPAGAGQKMIAHVCNDIGGWGKGFVLELSRRWTEPERQYRAWYRDGTEFALGRVQLVRVSEEITVANLIAQRDIQPIGGVPPIRYDALETCMAAVAREAVGMGASVHMPRIGCGLAGGRWEEVEPILQRALCAHGVPVYVYDR